MPLHEQYDAIVIGGGFFGCSLALSMAQRHARTLILEAAPDLLTKASFVNQARVHNGYHYPRSLITALRSAFNYPRFIADFEDCIDRSFQQVYAIARGSSRVSAYQYRKFCESVGIPLRPAPKQIASLFQPSLIEAAFCTEECAFDASRLRDRLRTALEDAGVEIVYRVEANRVSCPSGSALQVETAGGDALRATHVFNCTYSQVNRLLERSELPVLPLKHEVAEMAMIRVPPVLENIGITVMDGPYFSTMPFPALGLHSLSHVTYTPHEASNDAQPLSCAPPVSKSIFMLRDAQRYVPVLRDARYVSSLFENKTVLLRNEVDDGRPILCRRDYGFKNFSVILGAKIDNIYDVLKTLDAEVSFPRSTYASHARLASA